MLRSQYKIYYKMYYSIKFYLLFINLYDLIKYLNRLKILIS